MSTWNAVGAALRERIERLHAVESALDRQLREQERALLRGDAEQILAVNAALDGILAELRAAGSELRAGADDLAAALCLPAGSKLADVIRALPDAQLAADLMAARDRLQRARRTARAASAKNAAIARVSLDAIASVRGIVDRVAAGAAGPALSSRLDTKA